MSSKNVEEMLGKLVTETPIKEATSFEPSEIKGIKPNVKLSKDGHDLGTATQTYKG